MFLKYIKKILNILPKRVLLFLGILIGLCFYLNKKKRKVAFKNIKLAFPEKTNREIVSILRKSFINFGISIIETLIIPRIIKSVKLKGIKDIDNAIMLGIHEGSWELYNAVLAYNFRYAIFAREQPNKNLYQFLEEIRKENNIISCHSLKEFVRYLKNNYIVGLSFDHGADKDSFYVEFFGHLVPTPKGAVYLAKKYNRKIYAGFGHRVSGFNHILEFSVPLEPDLDEKDTLLKLNKIYEEYIRKYPSEYFWLYKRFKRKKNLEILILSDRKKGHLRQSEAFIKFLLEKIPYIKVKSIDIEYKRVFFKILADFCCIFSGKHCFGCGRCLRFILKKDVYKELKRVYADIVLSTGSFCASLNRIFSFTLDAKSISILRPNVGLSKFNFIILPEHDKVNLSNIVNIKGALYYPYDLEKKAYSCKDFFKLSDNKKISLFLGGPLYDENIFFKNLKDFVYKFKEFSIKNNYKLLISTSRRTPKNIEEYIEKEFLNFINTETVVFANRINYDFVFEGFVYFSDFVFVSSESISMISEVLSLKKPCVCLSFERLFGKYVNFLESIKNDINFLEAPFSIENIEPKISNLFEENKKVIISAIEKFL